MASSSVYTCVLFAALLAVAAAADPRTGGRNGRALRQANAFASSTAVADARNGGTAVSNVNSQAVSTGTPTVAVAQGASVAEAGETVITECNVFAKDSEQYKTCINTSPAAKTNVSANATAAAQAGVVSYEAAPTCSPPVANYTADNNGRLWGYQNGSSCAFRFADGKPVYQANVTAGGAAGGVTFDSAPACSGPPGPNNSTKDESGRLWGTLPQGGSCAYKDALGKPIAVAGQGASATASSGATAASGGGGSATAQAGASARAQGKRMRSLLRAAQRMRRHSTRMAK